MPYIRHGECNHCGWCCQFTGQSTVKVENARGLSDPDYYKARGFAIVQREGLSILAEAKVSHHLPCPQHVNERCSIYAERPSTCKDFPVSPEQIKHVPQCGYHFEYIERI